jgi:hypothetical protein
MNFERLLAQIAREHLGIETLRLRNRDRFISTRSTSVPFAARWRPRGTPEPNTTPMNLPAATDPSAPCGAFANQRRPTMKLTDTQTTILTAAADRGGELPADLPLNLKGGALAKVTQSLENRGLLKGSKSGYRLTKAGFAAIGREPAAKGDTKPKARKAKPDDDAPRRTRENSKQAQVIAMLKRREGATIAQICDATGWQAHTVRGAFAGAFKKRLGLALTSDKAEGGERVYRIG